MLNSCFRVCFLMDGWPWHSSIWGIIKSNNELIYHWLDSRSHSSHYFIHIIWSFTKGISSVIIYSVITVIYSSYTIHVSMANSPLLLDISILKLAKTIKGISKDHNMMFTNSEFYTASDKVISIIQVKLTITCNTVPQLRTETFS